MNFKTKSSMLAIAIASITSAPHAAQVSYNSTSSLEEPNGRTADGSGQAAFVAGNNYNSAGTPAYIGHLPATWYTVLGVNDNATLSSSDVNASTVHFGSPTIGASGYLTAGGASFQNVATYSNITGQWTAITPTNWGHGADFGLIKLTSAATVTISVAADTSLNSLLSPGFSVWQGWDTNTNDTRHTPWLHNGAPLLSSGSANPLFSTGLNTFMGSAWTGNSGGQASLTLSLAAGNYTVIVGGYQGYAQGVNPYVAGTIVTAADLTGGLGGQSAPYSVTLTSVSAVPLPSSALLFSSALFGLGRLRKKNPA